MLIAIFCRPLPVENAPLRLILNIDWLAYRYNFQTSGCLKCRDGQATSGSLLNVVAPPVHHGPSALNVIRSVVGAANLVLVDVGKCYFDQFWIPVAMFIENGTGH